RGRACAYESRTGRMLVEPLKSTPVDPLATSVRPERKTLMKVAMSRDGRRIAGAGAQDWNVFVIDLDTGRRVSPTPPHLGVVWAVDFSADGTRLVAAGSDTTARLWDAVSGRPVGPSLRHPTFVRGACIAPEGRLVATLDRQAGGGDPAPNLGGPQGRRPNARHPVRQPPPPLLVQRQRPVARRGLQRQHLPAPRDPPVGPVTQRRRPAVPVPGRPSDRRGRQRGVRR